MKVLIVNGSPHPKGCTYTALMEAAGVLEKEGIETTLLQLGTKPIQDCIACGKCVKTGYCVFKDDCVNEAIDLLRASDGIIVGSPCITRGPAAVSAPSLTESSIASPLPMPESPPRRW